ncbi:ATP-grasp domain-containing protein [Rummeliibacillus suwonensis]|uniref:ATP-grasp domain-containing protein n=1 Tax=Rummeliibacillus suwonensis TaxID=1306154 RepID=UPI00289C5ACC|nr:alpha-L-glutamate ligase [Rummeliibacillus suwonensis]
MKHAYLIYEQQDVEKNKYFIKEMIETAKKYDIALSFITDDEVDGQLQFENYTIDPLSFVWNRTRNPQIAKKLEQAGIKVFNNSFVSSIANNKKRTLQFGKLHGIPSVPILSEDPINQFPVIIKTVDGHGGKEVALCSDENELKKYQHIWSNRQTIIQPYIETKATDVRVWVLGSTIIGAVKRMGSHDFRSNYTLGGTIEKYPLNALQRQQVLQLQKALKSDYIGIDFLLLPNGDWLLNEIEDPVGARSFYQLYNEELPTLIMEYFAENL